MENVIAKSVIKKLDPRRMKPGEPSDFFIAILGAMLHQEWTDPVLEALICTSDGCVLGQKKGDIGYNEFLCSIHDLNRNLNGIAKVMGLTEKETKYLLSQAPKEGVLG
jgi:hypothetical protein